MSQSEPATWQRRVALALALGAFVLAGIAVVIAVARKGGGGDGGASAVRDAGLAARGTDAGSSDSGARRLDATHAMVRRARVDELLGKQSELLGFEPGDVIRGLNGMDVSTPAAAVELLHQFKSAQRLTIDLDRKGTPVQLSIEIR